MFSFFDRRRRGRYLVLEKYWECEKLPFNNVPDPNLFYMSRGHKEALSHLLYSIDKSQGIAVITGDIGSGKTLVSRVFINSIPEEKNDIAMIVNPMLSHEDFLREILYQLGVEDSTNLKIDLLHTLNNRIIENRKKQKNTIILIDEAQLIKNDEIFEELRLLLNFHTNDRFLLNLILIGQEELKENIRRLKQLDQRIAVRYHLDALNRDESLKYMEYRMKQCGIKRNLFTLNASYKIYEYSSGIPRKINNICGLSMLIGCKAKKNMIDDKVIEYAIEVNK